MQLLFFKGSARDSAYSRAAYSITIQIKDLVCCLFGIRQGAHPLHPSFVDARKLAHRLQKTYRVVESSAFSRYFCDRGDDIYAARTQSASETSGSETGMQGVRPLPDSKGRAFGRVQRQSLWQVKGSAFGGRFSLRHLLFSAEYGIMSVNTHRQ